MKFKEIAEQKDDALVLLEDNLRKELTGLRMQARLGQLKKTAQIGTVRRDIARVLTIKGLRSKE